MNDESADYPESVDDFDPLVLHAREWMALADYCAQEVWVWGKVAEYETAAEDREQAERSAEVYRMKGRAYKAYAAQEEQKQTEWEERRNKQ